MMVILRRFMVLLLTSLWFSVVHAAPQIEHWITDKGLRVYYVAAPELPMLDMRVVFAAGSSRDDTTAGVSMLTSGILNKGAAKMNADQIAEGFESVGAKYSAGSGLERSWLTLRTITLEKEMGAAIDTWLKVLSQPEFPEKDFERSKKQALIGLEAEKQDPSSIARKAFYKHLYLGHPYASPKNGSEDSIKNMTIEDLRTFYSTFYVAKNGVLAIVGDVDRKEAEAIANRVSEVLPEGQVAAALPEVKPLTEAKTIRIDFPSTQSHIYIGQPGNKRGDKDYFSLYLGNHVLGGGGFTSRLMKEIRVKRGFAYSVYSYFQPQKELGPYVIGMQTKNEQVAEAIEVANTELKQFIEKGPSEDELVQSQKNITGGFPLRTASNADIVSYVAMIGFYGLPLDYLNTFSQKIESLKTIDISAAFKRRVHPDSMLTIIVGKQEDKTNGEKKESKETVSIQ
ncbi:MAG: FIG015287: Zinc protease [uncultured Thiotrichaceae bacterium]|uniref:FIG015287: Zinc protease n=1 Tax=uncultured Thiotrichaceae bacterium TaxID=298394 RepID=A0A6S6SYE0_9GAMM|nr:MAG: FIG015287: Zinc protease [uncultured Thiotrichaceae bacterium]